ncbi:MAG: glycoside hydrolase family 127 protein [Clostridiales bacterium]|nr:glycoside hydrolase family 127 protein [Clostridiales bacterium]
MDMKENRPLALSAVKVSDGFWKREMELVRNELIPYQWEALNDRVEGADPSFCMRNFRVAVKQNKQRIRLGSRFEEPKYTFRGFESLPDDPNNLEDKFYGFVFQDSDFYKWVEAVAYSLVNHPDEHLEQLADEAIDLVCQAQQDDGYLDTYYIINGKDKIFTNLRDHHELYCFGHLVEGAVAYYQATGKDRLLHAAMRFADYIDAYFGAEEGKCKGYPGHEIAEMALVRLYEVTGERRYLALSKYFVDERGKQPYYFENSEIHPNKTDEKYHQSHMPVREQSEPVGHAVRAVYLYSGMADLARLYRDESLRAACERLWDNIVKEKMYITGAIGATHIGEAFSFPFDLPNDTAYAETCASIGLVFFARRMLQMKPDSKYSDVMELALYNGILSGMALDGKSFFYVNPLEVDPVACARDERKEHVVPVRRKWFGCACCPPNLARLLTSIGEYAYTEDDRTLYVHLYMGGEVTKNIIRKHDESGSTGMADVKSKADENAAVKVQIASDFPWGGKVCLRVENAADDFVLALRIPGWCRDGKITVCEGNGDKHSEGKASDAGEVLNTGDLSVSVKDGYFYIEGSWHKGTEITLDFPMEVRFMEADPKVREDIGKVALMRGPVVYCLEGRDNGEHLHLLSVDTSMRAEVSDDEIEGTHIKAIEIPGERIPLTGDEGAPLYREAQDVRTEPVTLHFIPYYTWANRGENEMEVWVRRV